MNLGQAIKSVRTHLNVSQKELAIACSISQNSLSQIENGIKKPKETTVIKICDAFQIPECLIYLLALEEGDISPSKRNHYPILHSSISSIAVQLAKLEQVAEPVMA